MSSVQTFRGETMQAALDRVKKELGPDAVILHTRELPKAGWLSLKSSNERFEITAGLDIPVRPLSVTPSRREESLDLEMPKPAEQSRKESLSAKHKEVPVKGKREEVPSRGNQEQVPVRANQEKVPGQKNNEQAPGKGNQEKVPGKRNLEIDSLRGNSEEFHLPKPTQRPRPKTIAATLMQNRVQNSTPVLPRDEASPGAPVKSREDKSHHIEPQTVSMRIDAAEIQEQLKIIRKMLEELTQRTLAPSFPDEPHPLLELLLKEQVEEGVARELLGRLKRNCTAEELALPGRAQERLAEIIEESLRVTAPILVNPGRRRVVALIGPTGVGKTTTIAKLAANFRLRDRIRVGLVTVDTYRIAAVDQLRTFAEIIDLPMQVATSAEEMKQALDQLAGLDLILVDTAGRSPLDAPRIREIRELLDPGIVDEVHFVQSVVTGISSIESSAELFGISRCSGMILTKLDESKGLGTLLSIAKRVPLPISYITTGQDVPNDIEQASRARLAQLILGQSRLRASLEPVS